MAQGTHPIPFRTRKLSPAALMVLAWRRGGGVSRRRGLFKSSQSRDCGLFSLFTLITHFYPDNFQFSVSRNTVYRIYESK